MIVVTGATGFIGRYLVDRLYNDGYYIIATGHSDRGKEYYRRKNIDYVNIDITRESDFDKLPGRDVDAVVHLAGLLSIDAMMWTPKDYMMVNAYGTYNVLKYCKDASVSTVLYSMTHSDVNRAPVAVIREDTPQMFGGAIPYIVSKIAGKNFLDGFVRDKLIDRGIVFRFPGIRGYTSRDTYYDCVFHQFIQKAIRSEPIEIWGDHKTLRDLIYIKDVVSAIIMALNNKSATGLYNIGSGTGLTIEDEAEAIVSVFSPEEKPSKLIYRPEIEEVRKKNQIFDIHRANHDFGWKPKYSYVDGLRDYKHEMGLKRFDGLVDLKGIK
jgi:UDP-glucose 4-epimerase